MDRFYDEQYVRLRNRELGKYHLHAADDGVGVSISQRRNSLNVAWKVHIYHAANGPYLLLHSAAYGHYLAATATPAPSLYHGFRAELRDYDHPVVPEIMWLDVRAGLGRGVLLLNAGKYLRANGKYLRWNTGVTVENRDIENEKVSAMMRWIVEPIALTERAPRIPDPIRARLPEDLSVIVFRRQPGALRGIRFVQATPERVYPEAQQGWAAFNIRGRSLYNLRDRLAREVDLQPDGIAMCIRAGRYGRLTPLVVDLPRRGWGNIYQIVVFSSGTAEKIGDRGSGEMFLKQLEESNDCKSKPSEAGSEQYVRRELSPNPSGSAGESLMDHPDVCIEAARAKLLVAMNRRRSIAKELTQATDTLALLQQQNVGALPKEERKAAVKEMRNVKEKIRKLGVAVALADEEVASGNDEFARSQLRHGL